VGVLAAAAIAYIQLSGILADHRVLGLLELAADESALERRDQLAAAFRTIEARPLFGSYASYEPGWYAHNILSSWVDMGLLGLALVTVVSFSPLMGLLARGSPDSRHLWFAPALGSAIVVALLLLVAKTYTYQMILVAAGLHCRYLALRPRPDRTPQPRAASSHGPRAQIRATAQPAWPRRVAPPVSSTSSVA